MYVTAVPNRNSPPAILLRESYREDGKVKTRTIANITHLRSAQIDALRALYPALPPVPVCPCLMPSASAVPALTVTLPPSSALCASFNSQLLSIRTPAGRAISSSP
jgi:hypothetical protein